MTDLPYSQWLKFNQLEKEVYLDRNPNSIYQRYSCASKNAFITDKNVIEKMFKPYPNVKYQINDNGIVDLLNAFSVPDDFIDDDGYLKLQFGKADFFALPRVVKSLFGSPVECDIFRVGGSKNLTSLIGSPLKVYNTFSCECCGITDLIGSPAEVQGDFDCEYCKELKTLKGAPKEVNGTFNCRECDSLESLEYSPEKVNSFDCNYTNIVSLKGCPKYVAVSFYCEHCTKLKSVKDCPDYIGNALNCNFSPNIVEWFDKSIKKVNKVFKDKKRFGF